MADFAKENENESDFGVHCKGVVIFSLFFVEIEKCTMKENYYRADIKRKNSMMMNDLVNCCNFKS